MSLLQPLPTKHNVTTIERFSGIFIEQRLEALNKFLQRIAEHQILGLDTEFWSFLTLLPTVGNVNLCIQYLCPAVSTGLFVSDLARGNICGAHYWPPNEGVEAVVLNLFIGVCIGNFVVIIHIDCSGVTHLMDAQSITIEIAIH